MLLKDCYSMEPPTERMDTFWSEISERMEESPAAEPTPGGGGARASKEGEIVFESSAAMQILNIPEPPPEPVASTAEAAESKGAVAPAPAASPWRWPVALIFSTAIVVVGILAYKKMNPPQQPTYMASAAGGQERGSPHPGDPGDPGQPGQPGQPGAPSAIPAPGEPPADEAARDETKTGTETAPGEEAKTAPGDEANAEPGAETKAEPAKHDDGKPRARTKARGRRHARKAGVKAPARPAAEPAPVKAARRAPTRSKKKKPAGDDLDSLIDGVIGKQANTPKKKKPARAAASPLAPGLPEKLGEGQIRTSMKKIMGRVQACYDKYQVEGNARVKLTITPAGKPSKVSIKGKFFGTDTGSCVVKAVKKARFPRFSGKPMTIRYPFLLQ